jgi:hypothetical protein
MIDWQLAIVIIIVCWAVYRSIKTLCFGSKDTKCNNCSNNPNKHNTKKIIWIRKE